ncbi:hypothetical protein KIPB_007043 [Kipferlia bialata]|uniref:Uncharacterized protein n=1 Tax=Kipferlia bialata TaxID=797122 RepID=A0A9K3D0K2_9EUKA|nr:hypothetical protein KIPB_007043 [Kipferlia bialata]|eukprot:g7043.t1
MPVSLPHPRAELLLDADLLKLGKERPTKEGERVRQDTLGAMTVGLSAHLDRVLPPFGYQGDSPLKQAEQQRLKDCLRIIRKKCICGLVPADVFLFTKLRHIIRPQVSNGRKRGPFYTHLIYDAIGTLADAAGAEEGSMSASIMYQCTAVDGYRFGDIVGEMCSILDGFSLDRHKQPLLKASLSLLCNLLCLRVRGQTNPISPYLSETDHQRPLATLYRLVQHPDFGKGEWQPKDIIMGLTRVLLAPENPSPQRRINGNGNSKHQDVSAILSHPLFTYILDPVRCYDHSNTDALRSLLIASITVQWDDAMPHSAMPYIVAVQGTFDLLMGMPHNRGDATEDEAFSQLCARLVSHFIDSKGVLRGSQSNALRTCDSFIKNRLASMPGPRVHGVPQSLVDTLTRCSQECALMEGQDAVFVRQAVSAFLGTYLPSHVPPSVGAIQVERVPNTPFGRVCPSACVSLGDNRCLILVRLKGSTQATLYTARLSKGIGGERSILSIKPLPPPCDSGGGRAVIDGRCRNAVHIGGKVYFQSNRWSLHPDSHWLAGQMCVFSMDSNKWETITPGLGEPWPVFGDSSAMCKVSETELFALGWSPDTNFKKGKHHVESSILERHGPASGWIFNTETRKWKKCPPPPPLVGAHWEVSATRVGSAVHVFGLDPTDPTIQYHSCYTMPTQEEPEGRWTVKGMGRGGLAVKGVSDNLALSIDSTSTVLGYNTMSDKWSVPLGRLSPEYIVQPTQTPPMCGDPSTFRGYASCMLNRDTLLVFGEYYPESSDSDTCRDPEAYLVHIVTDRLRDACIE